MYVQEYGTMIHIVSGQLVCRMKVVGNCYKLVIVIAPEEEYKNDTTSLSRNVRNQSYSDACSICWKEGSSATPLLKSRPWIVYCHVATIKHWDFKFANIQGRY